MELIKEAALNTLLGMGMTFLVLISLSVIIAMFGKILHGGSKKPAAVEKGPEVKKSPAEDPRKELPGIEKNVQEASAADASAGPEEDPELMAVIAAAVAAYEESDVTPETVAAIAAAIAAYEGGESIVNIAEKAGVSGFAVRRIRKSRKRIA